MAEEFSLAELVELLSKYNILTVEDLRDVLGSREKVTWTEFKEQLLSHEKNVRKITLADLRKMTDDAHVMIPEPGVDPPR